MAVKGEGSRGGHIIRHTKSGKAVYGASATRVTQAIIKKPTRTTLDQAKGVGEGLAIAAGGMALAAGLGAAAGGLALKAAHYENAGKTIARLAATAKRGRQAKLAQFAIQNHIATRALQIAHDTTRFVGSAAGSYYGTMGAVKALDSVDQRNAATEIAGTAAATKSSLVLTRLAEGIFLSPTHAESFRNAMNKMRMPMKRPF